MGSGGGVEEETATEGLRVVCPVTNGASEEDLQTTTVTSVVYTYQVESFHAPEEEGNEITAASQSEISEWITTCTLNAVASNLCYSSSSQTASTTFPCLYSLSHTAGLVQLLPCTSSTCAAVHPNILTLQHRADCSDTVLERATLLAVQTAMMDPILWQDLRQQFPTVTGMRLLWGDEDNPNENGSISASSGERNITTAGIVMIVVTGITVLAAVALLMAWWTDLREHRKQQEKPPESRQSTRKNKEKRKCHHNSMYSKNEATLQPSLRTQGSYLVQTKACTTHLQTAVVDPENCYLTEEDHAVGASPLEDHRPVLGALPWQHQRFDLYTIEDCTDENASLSSQSILEELEQLSKEELERRTLRVPSQGGSTSSSSSFSSGRQSGPPAGLDSKTKSPLPHPDDEVTVVPSSSSLAQQVRILGLLARSADQALDDDIDNDSNRAVLAFPQEAPLPSLLGTDDDDDTDLDRSEDSDTSFSVRLPSDPVTREAALRHRDHSLLLPRRAIVKADVTIKGNSYIPDNIRMKNPSGQAASCGGVPKPGNKRSLLGSSSRQPRCLKTADHGEENARKKAVSWKRSEKGSTWKEAPVVQL